MKAKFVEVNGENYIRVEDIMNLLSEDIQLDNEGEADGEADKEIEYAPRKKRRYKRRKPMIADVYAPTFPEQKKRGRPRKPELVTTNGTTI